jgi:hypothetical protein
LPGLQQRAGHGEQREGKADAEDQQPEDLQLRSERLRSRPSRHRHDRQQREAAEQQHPVQDLPGPMLRMAHELMREGIAQQQRRLEEHEARGPDRDAATEARQDQLRDDRLNQEQQEGTKEDGDAAQCHVAFLRSSQAGAKRVAE